MRKSFTNRELFVVIIGDEIASSMCHIFLQNEKNDILGNYLYSTCMLGSVHDARRTMLTPLCGCSRFVNSIKKFDLLNLTNLPFILFMNYK